jgi:RimJ/RimL family protein N-acetyltransferase
VDVASRWAYATLGLRRLELYHAVANPASCAVAMRAGFRLEGEPRASYRYGDGELYDEHAHARLAEDPAPSLDQPAGRLGQ